MLRNILTLTWTAAALAVAVFFSVLSWKAWMLPDLHPLVANLNATTQTVADASKQQKTSIAAIERDVRAELWHVDRTFGKLDGALSEAQGAIHSIQGNEASLRSTTDALTGEIAALHATTDAVTAKVNALPVDKVGTVLDEYAQVGGNINDFLKDRALHQTVDNLAGVTGHIDGITGDFQTRFHALLYPPPCKTFGCKLARAWPLIKDVPAFGESLYWTSQLVQNSKP